MKFNKAFGTCEGPLSFPMKDEDARDLEKKLETGDWSPFRFQKSDAYEYFVEGERADVSVLTDSSVDKEGDVIDPKSLDFTKFQKNPVVAFNHQYSIPPVGKSIWQKCISGIWKAKTQYIPRPENHPKDEAWFPDTIFHMLKHGSMRGKSLGGAASWREITKADIEINPSLSKARRISKAVEVWEYSVCPIGINSNSVVEAISKGILSLQDVKFLQNDIPELVEKLKELEELEEEMPEIKSFVTREQYLRQFEIQKQQKFEELQEKLPDIVDTVFKRLMGKVS